ncbi:NADPH-dependent F420 reductase [Oscillatoria sp. FACHB-1407]|uniref:NADPH-dependent F420 reductase n=1 Tax=Oscillatoria sp. FACHB-1407 TaxID=2692847 RepID=UPI001687826D|nr:NADPH-dependent F420 reductase [Oscillatoria sp. FACHB-1407]MBD2464371.1 NADPH-dependent F420 reductase [Oscillatoria sp. FACHB-1407]
MKIAVLGFGNVGQKLANLFHRAGHDIVIGLRSGSSQELPYPSASFKEAVSGADVVAIAIPFTAAIEVLPELADVTTGKIIIDSTNPLNADWSPKLLGQENSAAEEISRLLPDADVVKAFNTIFADVMDKPAIDGQAITAFIAGDNPEAKDKVIALARAIGYAPVDTGSLYTARYLESMAHLNIQIAVGQGGGTNAAFVYLQSKV